jgi:hypothetical protein
MIGLISTIGAVSAVNFQRFVKKDSNRDDLKKLKKKEKELQKLLEVGSRKRARARSTVLKKLSQLSGITAENNARAAAGAPGA